jgi:Acyltransferase family
MSTAAILAARTPVTRDRYVDFLRASSITVVVAGHWVVGEIFWRDGVIGTTNAITPSGWGWVGTWLFQVMPLFFFVGGFSNFVSHRSFRRQGLPTRTWIGARLSRLLRPSLVFVAAWAAIQVVLHVGRIGSRTEPFLRGVELRGATVPFGPLWFLVVYAGVVVLTPAMLRLHERFGLRVPIVMVAGSVLADGLRFAGGVPVVGWANGALVWLVPHQLGFFYADGRLAGGSRRAHAAMAVSGMATLLLLTNPLIFGGMGDRWFPDVGHYPRSLIGTDEEPITNIYPPTLCLLAAGFWSIGVALLVRGPVTRWLNKERPWRAVVAVNGMIMTMYLWHMTALLLAVLALWPLGFGRSDASSAGYWLERPLWVGASGLILARLVAVFGRFERPAISSRAARGGS